MYNFFKSIFSTLFIAVIFISCSTETDELQQHDLISPWQDDIVGSWTEETPINTDLNQPLTYTFNTDHSLLITRTVVEVSTSNLLGYRYLAAGKYELSGNLVTLNLDEIHSNNDEVGSYSDLSDLIFIGSETRPNITISFNTNRNELTLTYGPCGENIDCIGSKTLIKEKVGV